LADGGGGLVNATLPITFSLYDMSTAGAALWTESQNTEIIEGSFSVELGGINPLSFELFNSSVFLGMNVNGDGEMSPRQLCVTKKSSSKPYPSSHRKPFV